MSETRTAVEIGNEWNSRVDALAARYHHREITFEQFETRREELRKHYEPLFRYASSRNH